MKKPVLALRGGDIKSILIRFSLMQMPISPGLSGLEKLKRPNLAINIYKIPNAQMRKKQIKAKVSMKNWLSHINYILEFQ
jgi:hypothetical protein